MDLTDRPADAAAPRQLPPPERAGDDLLARALRRARWTIFWERLWPALASIATVIGLFLALSWLGLWLWLPPAGRAIGLGIFFLLTAAAFAPVLMLRVPSRVEGLRRLDRNSGLPHRPATAIADEIAAPTEDSYSVALWRAHIERALRAAKTLRAGLPMPRLALRDPFAVRALVVVLVVATFFAAGGERMKRVAAAFDWQGVMMPANFRVDAWVSPPPYTGRPPIILPGLWPGEPVQTAAALSVPAGSTLVVRATGIRLDVVASGGLAEPSSGAQSSNAKGTEERRFVINDAGAATVRGAAASDVTWQFTAIPDKPPTIALAKEPEGQARGALQLSYKLEDDYGVIGAQALFKLLNSEGTNGHPARPLYNAPDFPLVLPQARTKNGVGQSTKDLTEHPWAGSDVTMILTARDEAGNEGQSEAFEFRLPERPFSKPIARALVEQRRILALDGDAQASVLTALDALTLAPEQFNMESNVYLGLRAIFWQLARAKSDDQLRDVVARMWDMAVHLEDGSVSDAEQALRAAEEALRQALERGASDEAIKRLTDQLRAALDKFMQALAEQMRKNPQQLARPLDPNARQIRPQDLRSMIDRLEQMARSGARDAARRMLQDLQQMLENLQMARPGQQMDDGDDDMMSALDELGDMIRKQQQLRDRTFQQGQDQRRDRQRGQRGQQGEQGQQGQQGDQMGELRENQQALRDQLKKLMEELRKKGFGQGQQGQGEMDQLGRAGEAMGDAEGQLGEGNADSAVDSQGRALEALRRGAQNLAQSMQQQGMLGPGPNGQPGRLGPPRAQQETDPLGRPLRGREYGDDTTVKVPGEIDVQRARRILEELRRRFGENFRPQLELDYIERLLRDF
ncbi:MAG: TIGR02302 family protein [Hyphomicrobiales bacterium]|nr:TIGR02302 family protein [Hyphomicrobiales bacterium]